MSTHEGTSEDLPGGSDNGSGGVGAEGSRDQDNRGGGQRGFGNRRKRRRQRPQRIKRRNKGPQTKSTAPKDDTDRERIFQDIEGLLRRIREEAEETGVWTEDELREITNTVTNFTKVLEEEAEVVSERARVEYHRVREKLNHALRS
jgi:hypothetical protein